MGDHNEYELHRELDPVGGCLDGVVCTTIWPRFCSECDDITDYDELDEEFDEIDDEVV